MDRRRALLGLAALGATPRVFAQQRGTLPRIGVTLAQPIPNAMMEGFQAGLRELGYVEGKNIEVHYRSAEGRNERYPALFDELIALQPNVLVAGGGGPALRVAMKATTTIPIVSPASSDPVVAGYVKSLARPGGNVTGLSILESGTAAKRLELIKELLPKARRIAVLQETAAGALQLPWTREAARSARLDVQAFTTQPPEELDRVFASIANARVDALAVLPSAIFGAHRRRMVELAAKHKLITVWESRMFTDAGGLISYGTDVVELYRRAASYVDRILKGAKPADLPIEQATKFDLAVNLGAAKALGLTIPPSILIRANKVIA